MAGFLAQLPLKQLLPLEVQLRESLLRSAALAAQLLPKGGVVAIQDWVEHRMPDELVLRATAQGRVMLVSLVGNVLDNHQVEDSDKGHGKGKGLKRGATKARKKTPEESGFEMTSGGIYTRAASLRSALSIKPHLEVGNLEKSTQQEALPAGDADIEVLCNRQSVLGNPFNMMKAPKSRASGTPPGPEHMNDSFLRDSVCDAFDAFCDEVLNPVTSGTLRDVAVHIAIKRALPESFIGEDWSRDFGCRRVEDFRAALDSIKDLVEERRATSGGRPVRLVCHCVPLRCHCMSLAARL
mmetsp:Transcript_24965/g.56521  ORF Transcript_24965/g.56521 Transcript_24965/m.56521 type:complete len:296 (-) Transcript_24965:109-996(-)